MANPYAALMSGGYMSNPFAQQGWGQWRMPTDETQRGYYEKNPQEAYALYAQAAGGSPGGNLEQFIRQAFGNVRARGIYNSMQPGNEGRMFVDELTPELRQQQWQQWQAQTPYQRGENPNMFMGAGRRT